MTILRNPIDRVFSTYEFSIEVAARFLVHPNLTSAMGMSSRLRSKRGGISTLDIWPWKYLVPWMREDLFARVRFLSILLYWWFQSAPLIHVLSYKRWLVCSPTISIGCSCCFIYETSEILFVKLSFVGIQSSKITFHYLRNCSLLDWFVKVSPILIYLLHQHSVETLTIRSKFWKSMTSGFFRLDIVLLCCYADITLQRTDRMIIDPFRYIYFKLN